MDFPQPLQRGRLTARRKRFFADVVLDDGREIVAHCPNPGAMLGLAAPGLEACVSFAPSPTRKLDHTLELVRADGDWVGVNTLLPNRIAAEALAADAIPEFAGYSRHAREVRYGEASRVDFHLSGGSGPDCWLEIKNCHLMRTRGLAEFPDSVTTRGRKHLGDLAREAANGDRAVLLFLIQRSDCDRFAAARDIDPAYAEALDAAAEAGVEVLCYDCAVSPQSITVRRRVPWIGERTAGRPGRAT